MELSEDNLDIRKMQCLLDAAQVGWIEKESGGGRCRFSSLLGDALDLSNDTLSQNDFINSKIGASEINVEKERQIKAITEYENVRSELYGLLLQLEILSNTEIISKK